MQTTSNEEINKNENKSIEKSITNFSKETNKHVQTENNNSKNEDFKQLGISETLIKGLNEMQITRPSNIQIKAIPIGLQGFDLIAMSKNGTGKTISFGNTIFTLFV